MRASDLMGRPVFDADGVEVGRLFDIEAEKTGPLISEAMGNAFQISGLLVGPRAYLLRLGLKRDTLKGPVGLSRLVKRAEGYRFVWNDIAAIEEHRILLRRRRDELTAL